MSVVGTALTIPDPSRSANAAMAASLAGASGLAIVTAGDASWNLPLLASLGAFAIVSDLWAIDTSANASDKHRILMSGSFLAFVVAMVLLGGTPAALIGLVTIVVGHLRFGERRDLFLNNLVAYSWFPLLGGLAFATARDALSVNPARPRPATTRWSGRSSSSRSA
jgi:hypothetical protein